MKLCECRGDIVKASTEQARLRLVSAASATAGTSVPLGLQITLAPGWKTYWRYPGDAGVPPRFMLLIPLFFALTGIRTNLIFTRGAGLKSEPFSPFGFGS